MVDFEAQPSYTLKVSVTDDSEPPFVATAYVHISVNNTNDPPRLSCAFTSEWQQGAGFDAIAGLAANSPFLLPPRTMPVVSSEAAGAALCRDECRLPECGGFTYFFSNHPVVELRRVCAMRRNDLVVQSVYSFNAATVTQLWGGRVRRVCAATDVYEAEAPGYVATTLGVRDDEGDVISFTMVDGNVGGTFEFVRRPVAGGVDMDLTLRSPVDFEGLNRFFLEVEVQDAVAAVPARQYVVLVRVLDTNEPPSCSSESRRRVVVELANTSTPLPPAVQCVDPEGLSLSYSLAAVRTVFVGAGAQGTCDLTLCACLRVRGTASHPTDRKCVRAQYFPPACAPIGQLSCLCRG